MEYTLTIKDLLVEDPLKFDSIKNFFYIYILELSTVLKVELFPFLKIKNHCYKSQNYSSLIIFINWAKHFDEHNNNDGVRIKTRLSHIFMKNEL